MERDNRANRYTPETRERAVRMVLENLGNYPDRAAAIRAAGLRGVVRGKPQKTTRPDPALPCPRDKVNRQFRAPAPNRL